ncbi:MAG: aspartyl protease family protein [Gemmataceae bacterium]|nr:aspartyl protease family protein [Gemmataceae bacterium]
MLRRMLLLTTLGMMPLAASGEPPAVEMTVPFELLKTRHIAVEAKVNGTGPYRLIFDTGAPVVLLNQKIARESGLLKASRTKASAKSSFPGQSTVAEFSVGTVSAKDVPATVLDHPTLKAIEQLTGPVDGIVGYPFFGRYAVTIDYGRKTLTLRPNGHNPEDVTQAMMKSLFGPAAKSVVSPAGQWGIEMARSPEKPGVEIKTVHAGGAAAAAGLKVGDQLLTVAGSWTDSLGDCFQVAERCPPGKPVQVVVRREGREVTLTLTPRAGQ